MSDNGIDFRFCILCEKKKEDSLVENPVSHKSLLKFVEERNSHGDSQFSAIWCKLQDCTPQQLALCNATSHRTCYQEATHAGKLKRVKEKFESEDGPTSSKRKKKGDKEVNLITNLSV